MQSLRKVGGIISRDVAYLQGIVLVIIGRQHLVQNKAPSANSAVEPFGGVAGCAEAMRAIIVKACRRKSCLPGRAAGGPRRCIVQQAQAELQQFETCVSAAAKLRPTTQTRQRHIAERAKVQFNYTHKAHYIYPAPLHIYRVVLLLLRLRRGAAGNGLGTMIKYLHRTRNGAKGSALGATAKYLQKHRVAPPETAWAPRPSTCKATRNKQRRGHQPEYHDQVPARRRRKRPGHLDEVPVTNSELRHGKRPWQRYQVRATRNERLRGQRLALHDQVLARRPGQKTWAPRPSTCGAQRGRGLSITIKYLRRTTSGVAGTGPGTTAKYLRRTTSGAAGNGLSRYRGLLMCP
jgi:hypothetical protein